MKITVVGAGNVGATCANSIATKSLSDELILIDLEEDFTKGKAMDLWQTSPINLFDTRIIGTSGDYEMSKDSEVVVITAGLPRKPGMSRDDLIGTNAAIVKSVTENIIKYSPNCIIIVVSNPLDVMTYASWLTAKISEQKVFGMAGILDTARYKSFLASELNISPQSIHAILMGGHGDTMVPLPRYTTISGIPVTELIHRDRLDAIIERTKKGGGELVSLMGTSAWYAPGAAAAQMVEAVVRNQRRVFPVCVKLNGQYGLHNVFLGAPVVLGLKGIEKIVELQLHDDELSLVHQSANAVMETMVVLDNLKLF
jgi:malate dehydrogenase